MCIWMYKNIISKPGYYYDTIMTFGYFISLMTLFNDDTIMTLMAFTKVLLL